MQKVATQQPGSRAHAVSHRRWRNSDGQCVRLQIEGSRAGGCGSPTLGSGKGLLELSSLGTIRNGPVRGG